MTKEEAMKPALDWYDSGHEDREEFQAMIENLLATPAQEPVAWQVHPFDYGIGHQGVYARTDRLEQVEIWKRKGWTVQPLYTHPSPTISVQDPMAWQHIESAPKDGTRILCQDEKGLVDICEWTEDRFTSSDDRTFGGHLAYTSWMPLPHSGPSLPAAQQCKWPTCQTEEYQQALAEQIKQELVTGTAQQEPVFCEYCGGNDEDPQDHCMDCTRPRWEPVTQKLLNAQHSWLYKDMWIAMKDGGLMTGHYKWMQGRCPDRFIIGSNTNIWAFEATHVMPMNKPKHPNEGKSA